MGGGTLNLMGCAGIKIYLLARPISSTQGRYFQRLLDDAPQHVSSASAPRVKVLDIKHTGCPCSTATVKEKSNAPRSARPSTWSFTLLRTAAGAPLAMKAARHATVPTRDTDVRPVRDPRHQCSGTAQAPARTNSFQTCPPLTLACDARGRKEAFLR